MKRFIKYPSIEQFRSIIRNIQHKTQFVGMTNKPEKPLYDISIKLPTITAIATEKIHGTNAAVCFSNPDGMWVQSRTRIITSNDDNAGCAFAAEANKDAWKSIINALADEHNIDLDENIISIYYEWCGGSIFGGKSAVSGLDKMAIIFKHFKVSPIEPQAEDSDEVATWHETISKTVEFDVYESSTTHRIWNILDFPTYEIEIDFEEPLMSQNKMIKLVEEIIEPNSPVGKQLGVDGNTGEGIVVSFKYKDELYSFKVKGEKHSKTRVKTLTPVDETKEQLKQEVAQKVTPAWRLEQMFDEANDAINGGIPDIKNMGTFMKLLNKDIIKEESNTIAEAGLEPKEIFRASSTIARRWYQEQLNNIVMEK